MTYYHVNQGVTGNEPMLAIEAPSPAKAALYYFRALMALECEDEYLNGSFNLAEWNSILLHGCYVEDRATDEIWDVWAESDGVLKTEKANAEGIFQPRQSSRVVS